MSTITTTTPVTLHDWDTDWSRRDDAYELVRGNPVMPPPNEIARHIDAALLLAGLLREAVGDRWRPLTRFAVVLDDDPAHTTIREPDVLLLDRRADPSRHRHAAADVVFVAEIVSPGSARTDRIDKRHEYAAAGIPTYLLVDVRDPAHPTLTHYELRDGTYPEAAPSAQAALTIDGTSVTVRAAGLVD